MVTKTASTHLLSRKPADPAGLKLHSRSASVISRASPKLHHLFISMSSSLSCGKSLPPPPRPPPPLPPPQGHRDGRTDAPLSPGPTSTPAVTSPHSALRKETVRVMATCCQSIPPCSDTDAPPQLGRRARQRERGRETQTEREREREERRGEERGD